MVWSGTMESYFPWPLSSGDVPQLYISDRTEQNITVLQAAGIDGQQIAIVCPRLPEVRFELDNDAIVTPGRSRIQVPAGVSAIVQAIANGVLSVLGGAVTITTDASSVNIRCAEGGLTPTASVVTQNAVIFTAFTAGSFIGTDINSGKPLSDETSWFQLSASYSNFSDLDGSTFSVNCPESSGMESYELTVDGSMHTLTAGSLNHVVPIADLAVSGQLSQTALFTRIAQYVSLSSRVNLLATSVSSQSLLMQCRVPGGLTALDTMATGNLSIMEYNATNISNDTAASAFVQILTSQQGNTVGGSFKLQFGESQTSEIALTSKDCQTSATSIKDALLALTLPDGSAAIPDISVSTDCIENQAMGYTWMLTFFHPENGGNLPQLAIPTTCGATINAAGNSTCLFLTTQSPALLAQNGIAIATVQDGNQVDGFFRLRFGGFSTDPISYDASAQMLKSKLERLPSVGRIAVTRGLPIGVVSEIENQQKAYTWQITYISNVQVWTGDNANDWDNGFSQAWGRNVGFSNPLIDCDAGSLYDAASGLYSTRCNVDTIVNGSDPVNGYFRLCLNTTSNMTAVDAGIPYVQTYACSRNLRHDAPAIGEGSVQQALEELPQIGQVEVVRFPTSLASQFAGDYTWIVTFISEPNGAWCEYSSDGAYSCPSMGRVPLLQLDFTAAGNSGLAAYNASSTLVTERVAGDVLSGNYMLSFNSSSGEIFETGIIPIDASGPDMKSQLLAMTTTTVNSSSSNPLVAATVKRIATSKFRTYQWTVRMDEVSDYRPVASGNHLPFGVDMTGLSSSLSSGTGAATTTILIAGSAPLSGSFDLQLPPHAEAITCRWHESPERLKVMLQEIGTVEQVHVESEDIYVFEEGVVVTAGVRFTVYFVVNSGAWQGSSFPPGAGIRPALIASSPSLGGYNSRVTIEEDRAGTAQQAGTFNITHLGSTTSNIDMLASALDVKAALESLDTVGFVDVKSGYVASLFVGSAVLQQNSSIVTVNGTVAQKEFCPGQMLRIGEPSVPTRLAAVNVQNNTVTFGSDLQRKTIYKGMKIQIGTGSNAVTTRVADSGAAVQHVSVSYSTDASLPLQVIASGVNSSACIFLHNATSTTIARALTSMAGSGSASLLTFWNNGSMMEFDVEFSGAAWAASSRSPASDGAPGVLQFGATFNATCNSGYADANVTTIAAGIANAFIVDTDLGALRSQALFAIPELVMIAPSTPEVHELILSNGSFAITIHANGQDLSFPTSSQCYSHQVAAYDVEDEINTAFGADLVFTTMMVQDNSTKVHIYFKGVIPDAPTELTVGSSLGSTCSDPFDASLVGVVVAQGSTDTVWYTAADMHYTSSINATIFHIVDIDNPSQPILWPQDKLVLPIYKVTGNSFQVDFTTHLGDVPPMGIAWTSNAAVSSFVVDDLIPASSVNTYVLSGFITGLPYFIRMTASNAVAGPGYGPWSDNIGLFVSQRPDSPDNVIVSAARRSYEIQKITASVVPITDVQDIIISRQPIHEVQTIFFSASQQIASGSFVLELDGWTSVDTSVTVQLSSDVQLSQGGFKLDFGGTVTSCINFDAPDENSDLSVFEALSMLVDPISNVTLQDAGLRVKKIIVSDVVTNWFIYKNQVLAPSPISFSSANATVTGCLPLLPLASTSHVSAQVTVTVTNNSRAALPYNATSAMVKQHMEGHPDIVSVNVVRSPAVALGVYFWTISYENVRTVDTGGQLADVMPEASCTFTGSASCHVTTEVPRNAIGGYFSLSIENNGTFRRTNNLAYNAPAQSVADAINDLMTPLIKAAAVSGGQVSWDRSAWRVSFVGIEGTAPTLQISSFLTGVNVIARVQPVQQGNQLGGTFSLMYGSRETRQISVHAIAADMRAAIEAIKLPAVDLVHVSVIESTPTLSTWTITFSRPEDIQDGLIAFQTSTLRGIGAAVTVTELRKGFAESAGALAVSFDPPQSSGGQPITLYEIQWDVSPSFASNLPDDHGVVAVTGNDWLYRSVVVNIFVDPQANENATVGGSWYLACTKPQIHNPLDTAISTPLPWNASTGFVQSTLSSLGCGPVQVLREPSKVLLRNAAGHVVDGTRSNADAAVVILSSEPSSQIHPGDLIWMGTDMYTVHEFRETNNVWSISLLSADGATVAYLSSGAASPLYVYGRAYSWKISWLAQSMPVYVTRVPSHSLTTNIPGIEPEITIAGPPCVKCVFIQNLRKGREYFVRIRAKTGAGFSEYSDALEARPRSIPGAPPVVATPVSNNEIVVTWACPMDDGYGLQRCENINNFKLEWDSASQFNTGLQHMSASGQLLERLAISSTVIPRSNILTFEYVISTLGNASLTNGTKIYVRAVALNDVQFDDNEEWFPDQNYFTNANWGYGVPSPVTSAYHAPSSPTSLNVSPLSAFALRVVFTAPLRSGGRSNQLLRS
jgi:hypothetical protein